MEFLFDLGHMVSTRGCAVFRELVFYKLYSIQDEFALLNLEFIEQ